MIIRPLGFVVLFTSMLFASSCSALYHGRGEFTSASERRSDLVRTELFFGLQKISGQLVSNEEWKDFLEKEVSSRFPEGLTVYEAFGQYRGKEGRIYREPTRIVLVLHPPGDHFDALIDTIRALYKRQFNQESVLRVTTRARASF
jgi:hypothetical protein